MSGYNDPVWTIDEAIAGVVEEARDQGVDHVVWLSLRTSDDVDYSDPQEQSSINTFREYNEQLVAAAEASDGYLQVADWATYSNGASAWFEADGVHLTARGVDAVTTFIAGTVERVLAGEDVSPAAAPWTVLVPGAEGEIVDGGAGGADRRRHRASPAGPMACTATTRWRPSPSTSGATTTSRRPAPSTSATARALGVYEDPEAAERVQRDDDGAGDDGRSNRRATVRRNAAGSVETDEATDRAAMTVCPSGRSSPRRSVVALAAAVAVPPAVRRRPARRAALGARPPGDIAAPQRRRPTHGPASFPMRDAFRQARSTTTSSSTTTFAQHRHLGDQSARVSARPSRRRGGGGRGSSGRCTPPPTSRRASRSSCPRRRCARCRRCRPRRSASRRRRPWR